MKRQARLMSRHNVASDLTRMAKIALDEEYEDDRIISETRISSDVDLTLYATGEAAFSNRHSNAFIWLDKSDRKKAKRLL